MNAAKMTTHTLSFFLINSVERRRSIITRPRGRKIEVMIFFRTNIINADAS
jgi:hypothetical protein